MFCITSDYKEQMDFVISIPCRTNLRRTWRGIRRWDLVAICINGIIGAGIFGLPSRVYALIGTLQPHRLRGLRAGGGAYNTSALRRSAAASRKLVVHISTRAAYQPAVAFEIGWLIWLARVTAFAAIVIC